VEEVKPSDPQPLYICGYFAVMKNENVSRSIFNGGRLSDLFKTPPAVNISDVMLFLQDFTRYGQRLDGEAKKDVSVAALDFRHFFHQIRIHELLSRYFGISVCQRIFKFLCLPMGWCYSPFIAQALAWTTVLAALEGDASLRDAHSLSQMRTSDIQLPFFVEVTTAAGTARIYLTYDNVAIIGSAALTSKILALIKKECKRFNLHIKEAFLFSKKMLLKAHQEKEDQLTHLGVRIFLSEKSVGFKISIRCLNKWREVLNQATALRFLQDTERPMSIRQRQVAKWCGIVLHHERLRGTPLCRMQHIIAIMRRFSPAWDNSLSLSKDEFNNIHLALERACSGEPFILPRTNERSGERLLIAADASDTRGAWVDIVSGETSSFTLPGHMHIFLKELIAARAAIKHACNSITQGEIVLLEDNSACRFALTNKMSTNVAACDILDDICDMLELADNALTVLPITSGGNPADEPSRGKPIAMEKIHRVEHLATNQSTVPTMHRALFVQPSAKSSIRHMDQPL
jgi:hypothetical protein